MRFIITAEVGEIVRYKNFSFYLIIYSSKKLFVMEKMSKIFLSKYRRVLTKEEQKKLVGGFACYCNGTYKGEYGSVDACYSAC